MVKNRLYLVHRPTGQAVLLGKRGDVGWFTTDRDLGLLVIFFGKCEKTLPVGGDQDDFVLAMESNPDFDAQTQLQHLQDHGVEAGPGRRQNISRSRNPKAAVNFPARR